MSANDENKPKRYRMIRKKIRFRKKRSKLKRITALLSLVITYAVPFIFGVILMTSLMSSIFHGEEEQRKQQSNNGSQLTAEVYALAPAIRAAADRHGIPEYYYLLLAICMQESGGRGNNPFQVNDVTDVATSIDQGVSILKMHLNDAGCTGIDDTNNLKRALQAYNMGGGFITYNNRVSNGEFRQSDAQDYSIKMMAELGTDIYGDVNYVANVLRWYRIPGSGGGATGSAAELIRVARQEIGYAGGYKFYTWYGFPGWVHWCACFVSWCATEAGLVEQGLIHTFSGCTETGMEAFRAKGQWQEGFYYGGSYIPKPGDIIFFDWNNSGDADHVGIVESVENGMVYTIEGNSPTEDERGIVREKSYSVDYGCIRGYAVIPY